MGFELTYKSFGARAVLVEWPPIIAEEILWDVIGFKDRITKKQQESIEEVKSAYNALLLVYSDEITDFDHQVDILKKIYKSHSHTKTTKPTVWHIPVCYDDTFGIDLAEISKEKGLSKETIIKRHSKAVYTVYFIGFLPGFLYLGGLDNSLHTPRKSTPRLKTEKGAVAIGGHQTGVYPSESPGGWNIIGNTPVPFFDKTKTVPCFASPGDRIVFEPVGLKTYKDIKILVDAGVYQIESEMDNG